MSDEQKDDNSMSALVAQLSRAIADEDEQRAIVGECSANTEHQREKLRGFVAKRRQVEAMIKAAKARPKKSDPQRPAFLDRKPAA